MAIVWNNFTYDKKYVVDALNGDDASGDGIKKPFKTLSKLLQFIPKDKNSLIKLEDGEYTFGQDISDGFASCRVTIVGNKARTTLKQIQGLYSNKGGGSGTFTLEFIQLIFTIDAALTQHNLNNFKFTWNMYNIVIVEVPSNDYAVFVPDGGTLKIYNCINISPSNNLLRTTYGIIELTNCYGGFTSGYGTNNSNWDKRNNIITSTPIYDSDYKVPYDEIGVYYGEFAWKKNKFLIQAAKRKYLSFENKIDRLTAIPKMTSNTSPSGRAFAKDVWSSSYDVWYAFNQADDNDGYCSKSGSGGVGYLGYEFVQPIPIFKYALRSMGNSSVLTTMPKDWTLEGSNDGERWHILDTQRNQSWSTTNTDKYYYISYPKSFKMYRLNWTANNGHTGYTGINELKMFSGTSMVSYIPTINEKYVTTYGGDKLIQETFKNNYDKVRLVSNKESKLNEGKIFEHEIDLKKYEVNKITTIVNTMSLSENGGNYKNLAPKLLPSAMGRFLGTTEKDLYKAIEGDGILTSGKFIQFASPSHNSPVIFMLKPNGSAIKLNKIRVAFGVSDWSGNTTASDFEVQISKNSSSLINDPSASTNWETIYSINGNSKKDFIEIRPTTSVITPMIRIIIYKSAHSTYLTISEVEVYGVEVNDYMLIKPETDSYLYSISNSQLIYLRNNINKNSFTGYGFWKGESVDFTKELENKMYVSDEATPLGSGKVFKQKIDTSKIPIKKVSIE
ncbi:MAG: hypothetical protein E6230_15595 [Paenibacillus dendritiformis]|uniref:hypothetical protein n=1 Tax=uncultured Paenibacillus sp. TaxID=227322 RepID=UPI0025E91739|nr:hypothetical protein [uncultured Paenibacillus sp.]MDU5143601.1 hypothetical protein [Paenibacillus dendritiformis]